MLCAVPLTKPSAVRTLQQVSDKEGAASMQWGTACLEGEFGFTLTWKEPEGVLSKIRMKKKDKY